MYIFEAVCVIFTLCGLEKFKIQICAPISCFLGIKDENEIIKNHKITIMFTLNWKCNSLLGKCPSLPLICDLCEHFTDDFVLSLLSGNNE